jgi:hypothetical protein
MAYGDKFDPSDQMMPTQKELDASRTEAYASHRIPCRHSGAKAHHPCINKITNQELRQFAAHLKRITDAKTVIPINDDDEVIF